MSLSPEQAELKLLRTMVKQVFAPQALDDLRFSTEARAGLLKMIAGSPGQRNGALALISAVKAGMLSGILSEDDGAATYGALKAGEAIKLTGRVGATPAPAFLHRKNSEHGGDGDLSQAVALLRAELKSGQAPDPGTKPAGFGCMVHCALCAAALVDEGVTAFDCLVCLTCATDA